MPPNGNQFDKGMPDKRGGVDKRGGTYAPVLQPGGSSRQAAEEPLTKLTYVADSSIAQAKSRGRYPPIQPPISQALLAALDTPHPSFDASPGHEMPRALERGGATGPSGFQATDQAASVGPQLSVVQNGRAHGQVARNGALTTVPADQSSLPERSLAKTPRGHGELARAPYGIGTSAGAVSLGASAISAAVRDRARGVLISTQEPGPRRDSQRGSTQPANESDDTPEIRTAARQAEALLAQARQLAMQMQALERVDQERVSRRERAAASEAGRRASQALADASACWRKATARRGRVAASSDRERR